MSNEFTLTKRKLRRMTKRKLRRVKMAFSTKLSYHMATITVYETMDTALTCRLAVSTECLPINTFILDVIYSLTLVAGSSQRNVFSVCHYEVANKQTNKKVIDVAKQLKTTVTESHTQM